MFGADFPDGEAWLFSGTALRSVRYLTLDAQGRFVDVDYESGTDTKGKLALGFRQQFDWVPGPVFQIGFPPSGDTDH